MKPLEEKLLKTIGDKHLIIKYRSNNWTFELAEFTATYGAFQDCLDALILFLYDRRDPQEAYRNMLGGAIGGLSK